MMEGGDDANHESTFEIINAHQGKNRYGCRWVLPTVLWRDGKFRSCSVLGMLGCIVWGWIDQAVTVVLPVLRGLETFEALPVKGFLYAMILCIHFFSETNIPTSESLPPTTAGSVPNIPPPSALPAFAALSGSTFASTPPPPAISPASAPNQPAPPPKPPETTSASHGGNPFSIRAAPSQQHQHHAAAAPPLPPVPNVMMPAPVPPPMQPVVSESASVAPIFGSGQMQ